MGRRGAPGDRPKCDRPTSFVHVGASSAWMDGGDGAAEQTRCSISSRVSVPGSS